MNSGTIRAARPGAIRAEATAAVTIAGLCSHDVTRRQRAWGATK